MLQVNFVLLTTTTTTTAIGCSTTTTSLGVGITPWRPLTWRSLKSLFKVNNFQKLERRSFQMDKVLEITIISNKLSSDWEKKFSRFCTHVRFIFFLPVAYKGSGHRWPICLNHQKSVISLLLWSQFWMQLVNRELLQRHQHPFKTFFV